MRVIMHEVCQQIVKAFFHGIAKPPRRCLTGSCLDVGSMDINGVPDVPEGFDYTGIDIRQGPNVDVEVLPYDWPIPTGHFDVVLCLNTLEHSPQPWRLMSEMGRVLAQDGYALIVAPSQGQQHSYPVDCYRYFPSGIQGLADWANLRVESCKHLKTPPWDDVSAVLVHP
jgi:SAM-dependent methyltransferase